MVLTTRSRHHVLIRLTDERWAHISEEHGELAGLRLELLETITQAERVYAGDRGERIVIREVMLGKWLVVGYRELEVDVFVITTFFTRRLNRLVQRLQLWP